ncbi:hypothetical protein GCM10011529_30630 [Polymorphobacter glacialis]|uniref:Uncharacterized protein n=1 Tax=Sandarakinorhabdus glacialis TaxID=1614636 RepID=A0A917EBN0_9SPHN|nr:hypothetical protein [Polymorphobacter glacialis]GGE21877.1 hypothetical protein GCM10011529_30630 [Polymorphobacter glacialis]
MDWRCEILRLYGYQSDCKLIVNISLKSGNERRDDPLCDHLRYRLRTTQPSLSPNDIRRRLDRSNLRRGPRWSRHCHYWTAQCAGETHHCTLVIASRS